MQARARSEACFVAFAARALPRAFGLGLAEPVLAEHHRRAVQAIGARLVLACARERLIPHVLKDMSIYALSIQLPLRRLRAFGLHLVDESACELPELSVLLDLLLADRPALVRTRLLVELDDSAWNLALARAARDLREIALHRDSWPAPCDPENFACDGHPWHPMTKTRLGLRPWEVLRYGPDLCAQATVHAVDLARAHAQLAPSEQHSLNFSDISSALFPAPAPGFIRLPVHALQLRRLPRLLGSLWGDLVRPTDCRPLPARALLSLRTVALAAPALHLKLSADIHTTSARRLVSPASVHNGPRLSALLGRIQATDPDAARGLRIQPDLAAAGLHPRHGALAGQLGVIIRPDPAALARDLSHASKDMPFNTCPSEHPPSIIVCAALGERRPGGDLLLRELSADYPGDLPARLRGFLGDYLDLLIPPLLRLLTAHGVALEAHLQNTSLVHDRRPRGFLIRDLGGVRVHRARLLAAGHALDLAPGSFTITRELAEAQGKLMHTLVHAHLAALLGWIDDAGGPDPADLWPAVRQIFQRHLDRWAAARQHTRACAEDRAFFFADTCRSKALLAMRIDERVSDYAYTEVANALAGEYPASA